MPVLFFLLMTSLSFAQTREQRELREAAGRLTEIEDVLRTLNDPECLEDNRAFSTVNSGIPVACASASSRDGYEEMQVVDCTRDSRVYPGGYRFRSKDGHPHTGTRSPYADGGVPGRLIEFWSRNNALNETYMYLADTAGGPDSHDMKSAMFLLPRKVIPSVHVHGNEVEVTMATGEKVFFDKRTNAITRGALSEGRQDLTTDRFRRQPPNVHYSGTGISVRLNHRFEDPMQSAEFAEVKQGSRSCRIPRGNLFDTRGKLKSSSDAEFLRAINQSCPTGPGQSAFRI